MLLLHLCLSRQRDSFQMADVGFQMVHVPGGHAAEDSAFQGDTAQGHFLAALQRKGENVRAVQVFA